MSRTKAIRSLPSIEEVISAGKDFPPGVSHQHFLLETLRETAKNLRTAKPRVFYSMREIAGFFDSPLRTVALVYEALEKEGVLSRIRGSQTMLNGKENTRRFSIRGVIGIPIWLKMLVISSFTRAVNMDLEERLRLRGFVADLIFHSTKSEELHPDFAEKLLQHELDTVIWQNPDPRSRPNILTLRNNGIRILALQTTEAKSDLPILTYLQDWKPAYRQLTELWQQQGIQKVLLPLNSANLAYSSESEIFKSIVHAAGMEIEICSGDPAETLRRCKLIRRQKIAIGFLEILTADRFCNHEPLIMEKLGEIATLAFCRGPVRTPYLQSRGIRPDIVAFSSSEIAEKLVEDIQILPRLPDGIRHTFDARLWPQSKFEGFIDAT